MATTYDGKDLTFTVDGVQFNADGTSVVMDNEDGDTDTQTFADLQNGVPVNWFFQVTALTNLAGNAAAHGDRVRLSGRRLASGGVEIAIEDNGPGIPEDLHEEAFKPFSRLDEARNQNRKGVGLGLAIARDVARGHGGDVTLDRSELGGLKAVIRLPG